MNEKILNNLSNELSNVQRRKRTGIISESLLKEAVDNIDQFNRQLIQYFDEQISMHSVLIPNTSEYEYDYKFEPNATFYGGPYTYIEYNNGCYKIKRQKFSLFCWQSYQCPRFYQLIRKEFLFLKEN